MTTSFKIISAIIGCILLQLPQFGFSQRPNILWLTVEDMSAHLGPYNDSVISTPNLDQLAANGVVYDNAFITVPVCAAARAAILTGIMSSSQGSHHHRNNADIGQNVTTYPELMQTAGYYTTNPAKTDYQGLATGSIWNTNPNNYWNRPDKSKPFIHVINHTGTHESQYNQNPGSYNPQTITSFPPYYPNSTKARTNWASYYRTITRMDTWVGDRLTELDNSGEADNTIVFYYSDHGVGLPRGKRYCYDSGLKIPLIMRVPTQWQHLIPHQPGTRSDELVSSLDFVPTILNLAGATLPSYLQGRAYIGSNLPAQHQYIHGHRDRMDTRTDIVRTVRDKKYRYVRNYEYFKIRQQYNNYQEENNWSGIMQEIRRVVSEPNPPAEITWYFNFKPVEELFDTETDPNEMNNLAADPTHRSKLEELRGAHLQWRKDSRDLGSIPESMILDRRNGYAGEYDYGVADAVRIERAWEVLDSLPYYTEAQLLQLINDQDGAVRYWAAIGLGNLGSTNPQVKTALEGLLIDGTAVVEIAAARGLLFLGTSQAALNRLSVHLQGGNNVDLEAINVVDRLGSAAQSLQTDINGYNGFLNNYIIPRTISTISDPPLVPILTKGCMDPNYTEYDPTLSGHDPSKCLTLGVRTLNSFPANFKIRYGSKLSFVVSSKYEIKIYSLNGSKKQVLKIDQGSDESVYEVKNARPGEIFILQLTSNNEHFYKKVLNNI